MRIEKAMVFITILLIAVYRDLRTRTLSRRFLVVSMVLGSLMGIWEHRNWLDWVLSCGIGVLLLGMAHVSGGGIGEGDGWFFVVTGMFLQWKENLWLFLSGLLFCFVWCLPLAVLTVVRNGKGRKREIPFLPFLLPGGIWLAVC